MIAVVYANDWNIGDHLSARGIEACLSRPVWRLPFGRNLPRLTQRLDDLDAQDLVVVGGGGLLKKSFDPFWRTFLDVQRRRRFRFALWGIGHCDLVDAESRGDRGLHENVVKRAIASSFRDRESAKGFSHFGSVSVTGCPSHVALRAIRREGHAGGTVSLLQVDHPDLLARLGASIGVAEMREEVTRICTAVAEGAGLLHDAFDNIVQRGRVDRAISGRVVSKVIPKAGALTAAMRRRVVDAALERHYAPARVVVTSRLHGAIIGYALGKKVIGISGDRKMDRYFGALSARDWVVASPRALRAVLKRLDTQALGSEAFDRACALNEHFALGVLETADV